MILRCSCCSRSEASICRAIASVGKHFVAEENVVGYQRSRQMRTHPLARLQHFWQLVIRKLRDDLEGTKYFLGHQLERLLVLKHTLNRNEHCSWLKGPIAGRDRMLLERVSTKQDFGLLQLKEVADVALNFLVGHRKYGPYCQVFQVSSGCSLLYQFDERCLVVPVFVHEKDALRGAFLAGKCIGILICLPRDVVDFLATWNIGTHDFPIKPCIF
mmetsp:Transcript_6085/g.16878  ORF Transcript_6085/g.16878 Transcript_6085/m.16878 type:complete len:215 (+) Transcript_6085:199-843(+)